MAGRLSLGTQEHVLHPSVIRIIEEMRPPSPGVCPSDPEQPKQGSLLELRTRKEGRSRTDSYLLLKKQEIFAQMRLANQSLTPAPTGWAGELSGTGESLILKRRKLRQRAESSPMTSDLA
jgi:hypothetical protein